MMPRFFLKCSCFLILLLLMLAADKAAAQDKLPDTIAKIKPSIVAVGTFLPTRNPRGLFLGTGFAVADGSLILTNAHVIPANIDYEHLEEVGVFYKKNNQDIFIFAEQVAVDKQHDVAVLRLKNNRLPALTLGEVNSVREGQAYAFTGYPIGIVLGLYPVTHRGIISAITPNAIPLINAGQLNIKLLKRLESPYPVFQLDATAYPGNSGSPLYDMDNGNVIGIINKVFVQESKESILSKPSGISYAIPINHAHNLLKAKGLY